MNGLKRGINEIKEQKYIINKMVYPCHCIKKRSNANDFGASKVDRTRFLHE